MAITDLVLRSRYRDDMDPVLTLVVHHQVTGSGARDTMDLVEQIASVAGEVDEIRVDRTGVGFPLADLLRQRGVPIVTFNPAEQGVICRRCGS